ncbi:MAG: protein kinase [Verrucomicrobia bacterium]|nr:protein kinase [Verrucomicrobiota bacterium]
MSELESKPTVITPTDTTAPPERPKPLVPDHELIRRIGSGAYGDVWLARSVVGTYRAVKVVYRDSFSDARPYEREYHGIQKFEPISRSNDGFVDILQIGRNDEAGHFYYVMELADDGSESRLQAASLDQSAGTSEPAEARTPNEDRLKAGLQTYVPKTLRSEILRRSRLPFEECLRYALSLNLALGYLHRQGLIHRDIKPSNIIFLGGIPKLADIGLVTEVEEARSFVGTEGFIPPEGPNSPQADIYSLGKVLYEMSMGKDRLEFPEPFTALGQATDSQELEELNAVIVKACAPKPGDRYQSAEEMHVDLALLQNGKSVKSKRMLERRLVFARKAGAVVGVIALIAVGAYAYQQFQTREARRLAEENRQLASKETAERQRAEGLVNALQFKQTELELKQAENFFENDEAGKGVAYLARMLRQNPSNHIAAARLMSALTDRSFALPIRVFEHTEDLQDADFSPDGQHIVTCTGTDATGTAQVWDASTGEKVGKPMRHDRAVLVARFSPDGRFVVTASRDGSARLWDAATGEPISAPLVHERYPGGQQLYVSQAQFSPDGQTIVTVAGSKARVWKVPTGEPVTAPLDHGSTPILLAEFSPDGRRIVTSTWSSPEVKIWEASTGGLLFTLVNGDSAGPARFSPDGSRVVSGNGFLVRLWDANSGKRLLALRQDGMHNSARFSLDGLRLVTADSHRAVRIWDAQTGQLLLPPLMHSMEVLDAQFDPSGERLLTREQRRARIWDSRTGQPLTEWLMHGKDIGSARFSPDGLHVLTTTADKSAILWDVRPGRALTVALWHHLVVACARFSPDGDKVVTASGGAVLSRSQDGAAEAAVWDVRTGEFLAPRMKTSYGIQYVEFSPDGRRIVTASKNGPARVWDAQTGAPVTEPLRHSGPVRSARFSPDGKKVVTASDDGTARIWDAQTGRPLADALGHSNAVSRAEFSPDGRWVLTVSDKTTRIWDAQTGQIRHEFSHSAEITDARFSRDGKRIVTASKAGTAQVWDSQTCESVGEPLKHQDSVRSARFSRDGRYIVTASDDQTARVWDAHTGKPVAEPLMHKGTVLSAEFNRDGQRVITASADRTARVWDVQTGRPLTEPLLHNDWVAYAEFSPDGNRVVTACSDESGRIWELVSAAVPVPAWFPDLAEAVVGQRLVDQEVPEPVSPAQFLALKKQLSEAQEADPYTAWAKWLLADRLSRNTSLSSSVTGLKHLDRLIRDWEKVSESHPHDSLVAPREMIRLAPDSALASAWLARWMLVQDDGEHPHKVKEAEFLSGRALKLGPEEPEAWRAAAEVRENAGRLEEALKAIDRAIALKPDDAELRTLKGQWLEKASRDDDALHTYSKAVTLASTSSHGRSPGRADLHLSAEASAKADVGPNQGGGGTPPSQPGGGLTAPKDVRSLKAESSQGYSLVLKTTLLARARLLKRLGREEESAADNLRARGIPPRDPQTKPALIDLSSYYNLSLMEELVGWPIIWRGKHNLASLTPDVQVIGGVQYDIRGVIRVGWIGEPGNEVKEAAGILVDQTCRQLHFLHAADGFHESPFGTRIGNYTVEYMDGQREVIPIEMNKSIGALGPRGENDGDAKVVWREVNEASLEHGNHIRLFKLSWSNPRPEARIRSIKLEYLKPADVRGYHEVIFLVAITAQNEPTAAITQQPQPQTVAQGENVIFRVGAESQAPMTYQWQFNGADIPGATTETLSLAAVTRDNAGTYTVQVRNAVADSVRTLASDPAPLAVTADGLRFGALRCEMFTNITGLKLSDLTNHSRFPNRPDATDWVHQFETPADVAENYGVRLTGYLVPPKTGDYRFYICSDDEGAFFLSTNESPEQKRQIAHEPTGYGTGNAARLWTVSHSRPKQENISEPIHLEAGRRYYIEALMKEGAVRDNLAVTWQMPGEPPPENLSPPIPGTYLACPVSAPVPEAVTHTSAR